MCTLQYSLATPLRQLLLGNYLKAFLSVFVVTFKCIQCSLKV